MPKPAKRARTGAEEGASGQKLASAVLSSVTCPISQALVVDPVMAEDGAIYERDQITKWLSSNNRSPVTNAAMGARLVAAQNTRSLVESLLESESVDDDAAAAWHSASARKKIAGELPGGVDAAKVHLDRAAALVESSAECVVLREALALRDQHKGVLTKAAAAGVTREVESILSGRTRSPMTAWRPDLKAGAIIRLIDDRDELKRLFGRPAPGSQKAIGQFFPYHDRSAGREGKVNGVIEKYRAYRVSVGYSTIRVPFDACILIDESINPADSSDDSDDSDDSSSDDSDFS